MVHRLRSISRQQGLCTHTSSVFFRRGNAKKFRSPEALSRSIAFMKPGRGFCDKIFRVSIHRVKCQRHGKIDRVFFRLLRTSLLHYSDLQVSFFLSFKNYFDVFFHSFILIFSFYAFRSCLNIFNFNRQKIDDIFRSQTGELSLLSSCDNYSS